MNERTAESAAPGDRPCPQCMAQPGQPCRKPNGDRYITLVGTPKYHEKRSRRGAKS